MCKLKKLIASETESKKNYEKVLAEVAGCSESTINKFKNSENRGFEDFYGLIKIVRYMVPEREFEYMIDYSKYIDVNKQEAQNMLEYLSIHRQITAFGDLIIRMKNASIKSKEWATMYEYMYEWQRNFDEVDQLTHLNSIRGQKIKSEEMNIFKKLLEIYAYYNMMDFKMTFELIKGLEEQIHDLKDGYIKTTYTGRLNELLSHSSIRVICNPEQARVYALDTIKNGVADKYIGYAYYIVGLSYFYESFDKALMNYKKSLTVFEEMKYKQSSEPLEESIEFLYAYWGKRMAFKELKNDIFYRLKTGQSIEENTINKVEHESFRLLLLGIYKKDMNLLLEAAIKFIRSGDSYTAIIAKEELNKIGIQGSFLESLIKINDF